MENLRNQIIPGNSISNHVRSIITIKRMHHCIYYRIFPIFLFFIIISFSNSSQSQWQNVGTPGFSAGHAYFQSLAFDGSTPYVGYRDDLNGYKSTVMKFNGVSWENVGDPGFGIMDLDICLKINNGIPYVALGDNCIVMKFNGTDWEYVGIPGFAYSVDYMNIDFYNNIPYVAFRDNIYATKASAMKFDGSNWIYIGNPGFSIGYVKFVKLAMDGSTPYVAYSDGSIGFKATVKKFDGSGWVNVGIPGFSTDGASFLSLALNAGSPYVAYQDGGNGGKTTVMKFNGVNWENVGDPGFSEGPAAYQSLVINGNTPYVAYLDGGNGNKSTLMKFNGSSWENVGNPGFTSGVAEYQSLAFDGNTPYVAFQDWANGQRSTVMRIGNDPTNCDSVCTTNSLNISTGFDHNSNSVYPDGSSDAYWELTMSPMIGLQVPKPAGVVRNFAPGAWADQTGSKWINPFTEVYYPNPLGGGYGNNFPPSEPYVFQTCFCICEDNTQITINLSALADDSAGVYLDDVYIPGSTCNFSQPTLINFTRTLNAGTHCIKVKMRNLGGDPLGINILGTISGTGILKRECCNTTSTLMGMKFNDLNHNSVRDLDEPGIPNWPIKLNNGTPVLTDAFGFYTFSSLAPGNYTVSEVNASGWTQSFPSTSNYNFNLGTSQVINNLDFGNYEYSSSCDTACSTDSLNINTGYDHSNNSFYPGGSYDEYWKIVTVPSIINVTVPRNAGVLAYVHSLWGTSQNSRWLSVDPLNYWQPQTYAEPYIYETKFCVCEDNSTINFDFAIMTDDEGFVYIDNVLQSGPAIGFGGQSFYNFSKTLSQGEHKLQVFVTNSGPTGINVSGNITGTNLVKRECCGNSSSACDSVKICAKTLCPTDQFTVCLANSYSPYDIVHTAVGYPDAQGCTYYKFPNANPGESYYIVVRTANSLETWSATPQIVKDSTCLEYDFTTDASKAYGNNMLNINGVWTLYSGDINQDGVIDLLDLVQIYNVAVQFGSGVTDLNCDGITDLNDILIAYNNATLFAEVKKP